MDSDIMPNEGSSFYVPEIPQETIDAQQEELKATAQAAPFIEGVDQWFDEQIALMDSMEYIRSEAKRLAKPFDQMADASDMAKQILQEKKAEFMTIKFNLPSK